MYTLPTRDERDEYHDLMVERLMASGQAPPLALIDYFGDRFAALQLHALTGCHFRDYLANPRRWDIFAGDLIDRARASTGPLAIPGPTATLTLNRLN